MHIGNYRAVDCVECGAVCRVPAAVVDELGGEFYCSDCRTAGAVPEGHRQHPETESRP